MPRLRVGLHPSDCHPQAPKRSILWPRFTRPERRAETRVSSLYSIAGRMHWEGAFLSLPDIPIQKASP